MRAVIFCRTLGPAEMTVDGRHAPRELVWRKHHALVVYLARSPKRTRARDHLVGLLWGDKPERDARHSLNEALRVLRRCAGDAAVGTSGDRVALAEHAVELDVDRMEAQAAAGDWAAAAEWIAGEFLEGFSIPGASEFEDWLSAERLAWRQRSVEILVRHAQSRLDAGDVSTASQVAGRALTLDPASDAALRVAVAVRALAGDRAGALELYDAFARRLREEFDIEPDVETEALVEQVRHERTWSRPRVDADAIGAESRRAPLVGRGGEMARLLEAWQACRAGRAAVAWIEGEAGTGRTRLAEELLARARLDGALTIAVRAVEADSEEPWSGVIALARGGLLDAPRLQAAPPEALAAFTARLPEWAARFGELAAGDEPLALGSALREILRVVTAARPVALCVDDAHWLDRESALALAAAVRDRAEAPLLLALTVAHHAGLGALDDLRTRIGREVSGTIVSLDPLTPEELRELARWALPRFDDIEIDRVTRRIAMDSAGIPLLAVELFHAVAIGLDLKGTPAAWPEPLHTLDQSLPGDLPDSVVAAIRVGFRRLSQNAQTTLAAASVLGARLTADTLERATALTLEEVHLALDELEWGRWLAAEPRGYSFVARIVRDIVARDMVTAGQRQRILDAAGASPA